MKKILIVFAFFLFSLNVIPQQVNSEYDSLLARKLGADEYGMKNYVLVILKTGPTVIEQGAKRDSLFKGHMANINKLASEGKLFVAGPFGENSLSYRGIFILNVGTVEEARILLDSDPTVREKIFDTDLLPWYGSAALGEYLKTDSKIHKYRY
jgi:uncharacterized protein YciI